MFYAERFIPFRISLAMRTNRNQLKIYGLERFVCSGGYSGHFELQQFEMSR